MPGSLANMMRAKSEPWSTSLNPVEEVLFRQYLQTHPSDFSPYQQHPSYDMRGFFKAMLEGDPNARQGLDPVDHRYHWPDTYKTPFHESFNQESKYAAPNNPYHWGGDPNNPALLGAHDITVLPARQENVDVRESLRNLLWGINPRLQYEQGMK